MDINKQLLTTRLSIVMVRESYTFLNNIEQFKVKLKEYFKVDYSNDEVEVALNELQDAYLADEYEEQQHQIMEIEEDFIEHQ